MVVVKIQLLILMFVWLMEVLVVKLIQVWLVEREEQRLIVLVTLQVRVKVEMADWQT